MSHHKRKQLFFCLVLVICLVAVLVGCSYTQYSVSNGLTTSNDSSNIYGDWEDSSSLVEEQLLRGRESSSSGVSSGAKESSVPPHQKRFRDTESGEPLAIYKFVNRVLVDTEDIKITLQAKTADELGDAGFTLTVENRYEPLTSVGYENYCYVTPVMGTWTVNGEKMDPKSEGRVYPSTTGTIYLYFDDLSNIEDLVEVKGEFEVYYISDWWNPIGVFEFYEP